MFSGAPEWKVDTDPANNDYLKTPLENSELKLSCPARGKPRPDTLWYKDGEPYSSASERVSSRSFSEGQSSLDQQLHMSRLKSNVTNVAYIKKQGSSVRIKTSCWCKYINIIGKQQALSLEVTCNFKLYLRIGRTSVKPSWKIWIFMINYRCLHTGVPSNTG